jgi:hypothetical protein
VKKNTVISIVFMLSAIYDAALGAAFLLFGEKLFARYNVAPPNHWGYVQFPAALLIIFALMFFAVAGGPQRNRNLIPYGILLKVAYSAMVFWYWAGPGIPDMWKPFAVADALFAIAFAWSWVALRSDESAPVGPARVSLL